MTLYSIALNNIIRKKTRMLLILCSLAIGIATSVALFMVIDAMRLALGDQIDEFGANIVIIPKTAGMEINYEGTHITRASIDIVQLKDTDIELIAEIPDYNSINIISPKMVAAVKANDRDLLIVGLEPRQEFIMKSWYSLAQQTGLEPGARPADPALLDLPQQGIIAGADAAQTLNISAGDTVTINGNTFEITGIFNRLGSVEDGLLFANLSTVQNLLNRPGEISMIEISAYCNACPVEELAAQISEVLPNGRVTALRQAALLREETIDRFAGFSYLLSAVMMLIAAVLVLITMMSSVHERTREIGIFRAIGFRGSHIMLIILLEAALIGILGGLAGYLGGSIIARLTGSYLAGTSLPLFWQTGLLRSAVIVSLLLSITAAAYPAKRAANLDPASALRFI